jgi:hypothetical protein
LRPEVLHARERRVEQRCVVRLSGEGNHLAQRHVLLPPQHRPSLGIRQEHLAPHAGGRLRRPSAARAARSSAAPRKRPSALVRPADGAREAQAAGAHVRRKLPSGVLRRRSIAARRGLVATPARIAVAAIRAVVAIAAGGARRAAARSLGRVSHGLSPPRARVPRPPAQRRSSRVGQRTAADGRPCGRTDLCATRGERGEGRRRRRSPGGSRGR